MKRRPVDDYPPAFLFLASCMMEFREISLCVVFTVIIHPAMAILVRLPFGFLLARFAILAPRVIRSGPEDKSLCSFAFCQTVYCRSCRCNGCVPSAGTAGHGYRRCQHSQYEK